jgi:hypothetical protein
MKLLQVFILIFGLAISCHSQSAILSGTVYDQQGAVIQNAEIILKDKKGKDYKAKTNDIGKYEIQLPEGIYTIVFSANLFVNLKIKNHKIVSVSYGKMTLDVALKAKDIRNHRYF